jgi:hypothetical protein
MNDFDGKIPVIIVLFEFRFDQVPLANQKDLYSQSLNGSNCTFYFRFRRVISAQGVEGDRQHKLLLSDFNHFTALVLATIRAHVVRTLVLMAVRAFGKDRLLQGIMSAAFAGARGGVSTFRIRHFLSKPS